jgi:hypothetical protein
MIIKAEDAPLGVPLWPTNGRDYLLSHHTLKQVVVVRSTSPDLGSFVRWTYQSRTGRRFRLGDEIEVEVGNRLIF